MTLRTKFLMALMGMIFFMAIVFGVISMISVNSFLGHTLGYIQQGVNQQLNQLLSTYYVEHAGWAGIETYLKSPEGMRKGPGGPRELERLLVFDNSKKVIASTKEQDIGRTIDELDKDKRIALFERLSSITVDGNIVGYYFVEDKFVAGQIRLARNIARSITNAAFIGLVLTAIVALILGFILTRRFTVPLRELTNAVEQVTKGNLRPNLKVRGGDEIALVGKAFNDMTEKLARNEEVRRNMVADIAHELRTPLSIISGKLESIQEGILPATPENLLPIQDETIRLSRLVKDLQQLSLAEAGKLPLTITKVELKRLITRIYEHFMFEFEDREIRAEIIGEQLEIQADPDRLTQVFVNIIGNALLHTPSGGKVTVCIDEPGTEEMANSKDNSLSEAQIQEKRRWLRRVVKDEEPIQGPKEWARVTIQDTGEGIPEEELEHIFDRFYRIDQARNRETGGTGLGLAIAKEFIQAHGGEITVESKPGEGSIFKVLLLKNISSSNS